MAMSGHSSSSQQKESITDDETMLLEFEMTSAPLEELDLVAFTSHVPFNELIDRLQSHLHSQARMPNLDERLRMAAAKAIKEGRTTMTDMAGISSLARVEKARDEAEDVSFYMIAAE